MTVAGRILPQPFVSLAVLGLWLVIVSSFTLGSLLLGTILAVLIPIFTQRFWPNRPLVKRPVAAIGLFALVCWDIVNANWQVARLVLGPIRRIHPRFFDVPIDLDDPFVATLLASIISLTPGTVSVDIDMDARVIHVHGLSVDDEAAAIRTIKARYEAPLKEIFQC
ncbi:MAG: Na+/H+ antiporter subunit E [Sandarakinorhabdus sp.]|nr:Na+/H+ antiporter subunit E [Sandarakinorhabdus sp.]